MIFGSTLHPGLILAAIIPAIFLLVRVYKSDKMEKEPIGLLLSLIFLGIISTFIALVIEELGDLIILSFTDEGTLLYNILTYFIVVAFAEEGAKYGLLKIRTWRSRAFDCRFDGVVYAVFVSLGFALWENIAYVLQYGWGTALIRAVTAVPGHASFGVLMGVFYGLARACANQNKKLASKVLRVLALLIPALVHGAYDFLASSAEYVGIGGFYLFIIAMFVFAFVMVNKLSKRDMYI